MVLAGWLVLCFSAATSAAFMPPGEWYAQLRKPAWNPPAWIFGPVWTTLYAMMAVAAWLVWRRGGWSAQARPLGWFVLQWFFNAAWTPLFFGLHQPGIAFAEILLLWGSLLLTLVSFWRVNRFASALLVPYLLWVSFASALNIVLWQLNP